MKILITILTVSSLLLFTSCNQKMDSKTMLKDANVRSQMMQTITSDHSMMTEFIGQMKDNKHAMQMMQGDKDMMQMMMKGEGMQMMKDKGMMSEKSMQSCMKMMKDKGMDMMGKMDKNKDGHNSHKH